MTDLRFAVAENPNQEHRGKYGIIIMVGGEKHIQPIGKQTFPSPDAAVTSFRRALDKMMNDGAA